MATTHTNVKSFLLCSSSLFLFLLFLVGDGAARGAATATIDASTSSIEVSSDNKDNNEEENERHELDFKLRSPPTSPPDSPCMCHHHDGTGARIAYLITIHNQRTMQDAAHLFRAIRAPGNIVIVHIDVKFGLKHYEDESVLKKEVQECPCGADVYVDSVHDCRWSSWSMNDPTHWSMDVLSSHPRFRNRWDVYMNLSGDTMAAYKPNVISQLFAPKNGPLHGINFVTSSACETGLLPTNVWHFPPKWHKREHYTNNPKGDFQIMNLDENGKVEHQTKIVTYFGSQWMSLQPDFVEYLVQGLKREDSLVSRFKKELIQTRKLMTDETFIPSLLMHHAEFNKTLPAVLDDGTLEIYPFIKSVRYERMDEHYPSAAGIFATKQRYDDPESSTADKPKVWGLYYLGVYDLADIRDSGALFIRKVTTAIDENILRIFPVQSRDEIPYIQWPEEVKIIKKPDWKPWIAYEARKREKELQEHYRQIEHQQS